MSEKRLAGSGSSLPHLPSTALNIQLDDRKTVHWECQVCSARNVRPLRVHKLVTDVNKALTYTHCQIQIVCVDCGKSSISVPIDIREAAELTKSPVLRQYADELAKPVEVRDDSEEWKRVNIERQSRISKIGSTLSGSLVGMHVVGLPLPLIIAWPAEHFTWLGDSVRAIVVVVAATIFLMFLNQRRRAVGRLYRVTRAYYDSNYSSTSPAVQKALRLVDLGTPASILLPAAAVVPVGIHSAMDVQQLPSVLMLAIIFLVVSARMSYLTFRYRRMCGPLEAGATVPLTDALVGPGE